MLHSNFLAVTSGEIQCYQQSPNLLLELWILSFLIYSKKSFSPHSTLSLSFSHHWIFSIRMRYTLYCVSLSLKINKEETLMALFLLVASALFFYSYMAKSFKFKEYLLFLSPYLVLCAYFNSVTILYNKMHRFASGMPCTSIQTLTCSSPEYIMCVSA